MGNLVEECYRDSLVQAERLHVLVAGNPLGEEDRGRMASSIRFTAVQTPEAVLRSVQSAPFDAVLLDMDMLGSRGLETVRELAMVTPRTCILAVTGLDNESLAVDVCQYGAQDHWIKGGRGPVEVTRAIRCAIARKAFEAELARRAYFDALTGLVNRPLFLDRLRHALARATRADMRVALLFLDLDNFKVVNDSLGHDAGDEVLRAVAGALNASVRKTDTVARLGGDEFTVLLEPLEETSQAEVVARKALRAVDTSASAFSGPLRVTASIGIAVFPEHATGPEALIRAADAAMLFAKKCGGNRARVSRHRAY